MGSGLVGADQLHCPVIWRAVLLPRIDQHRVVLVLQGGADRVAGDVERAGGDQCLGAVAVDDEINADLVTGAHQWPVSYSRSTDTESESGFVIQAYSCGWL